MNIPGTTGKSSCKRQENGDRTKESERPLKKARFAWQVKGRYHLKNDMLENKIVSTSKTEDMDRGDSSSESDSNELVGNTEQNLEILGDYLLKQDFNTLDSVITDTDKSLLPGTSIPSENLEYPRYVSSFDRRPDNVSRKTTSHTGHSAIPISMALSHAYSEDECIARWQARQMAKGFVDNTINRVLDSWLLAPLPAEMDNNRFLALDVAEFINNLPGDNSIENEGILMAISAHGLQNTSSSSSCNVDESVPCNSLINDNKEYTSPPSSPVPNEDVTNESLNNSTDNSHNGGSSSESDMSWSFSEETVRKNVNNLTHLGLFPDTSNSHYQYFNESHNLPPASINYENVSTNNNDIHYDFLDAAVSFAIQNKGLTSYGTDYG